VRRFKKETSTVNLEGSRLKCEFCGEEVVLPFQCSFCSRYFCPEHRLPENHSCLKAPPRTPFGHWKAKKPPPVEYTKKIPKPSIQGCPKCGSTSIATLAFDKKNESLQCRTCGYNWKQPRKPTISTRQFKTTKPIIKEKQHTAKTSLLQKIVTVSVGSLICVGGLAIVLWEIYNPWFWTIFFIWFIPVPLVLIGIGVFVFGILVSVAGAFHKENSSEATIKQKSAKPVSKKSVLKKIIAVLLIVIILGVVLYNSSSIISFVQKLIGYQPTPTYSRQELVNYALSLINKDRSDHDLSNVSLSLIKSGQNHADNMIKYHFFSHWDTNGYKPYMRYTLDGGQGSVAENIAWKYSSSSFGVKKALEDLEWQMMYNDSYWDWGHRNNILNPFHNKVSIGIAYDDHNLYFVQDFENDYIRWSTMSITKNGEVTMSGSFESKELSAEWINIFYDPLPSNLTSVQLEKAPYDGGYAPGNFVGMALPSGYESVEGITITAQTWIQTGKAFQIRFNLSQAFNAHGKGVHTLYLQTDPDITEDSLTSYSFWYD